VGEVKMELKIDGRGWELESDVVDALLTQARIWETPNDTLRRLLLSGAGEGSDADHRAVAPTPKARRRKTARKNSSSVKRPRAKAGTILPEPEYDRPILGALVDAPHGRLPKTEVVAAVGQTLRDRFLPADHEMMGNEPRWAKRAQFRRLKLVQQGLMSADSPRGMWEVTEAGRAFYEQGTQRAA
jgi:Mrr N-terminal domain